VRPPPQEFLDPARCPPQPKSASLMGDARPGARLRVPGGTDPGPLPLDRSLLDGLDLPPRSRIAPSCGGPERRSARMDRPSPWRRPCRTHGHQPLAHKGEKAKLEPTIWRRCRSARPPGETVQRRPPARSCWAWRPVRGLLPKPSPNLPARAFCDPAVRQSIDRAGAGFAGTNQLAVWPRRAVATARGACSKPGRGPWLLTP